MTNKNQILLSFLIILLIIISVLLYQNNVLKNDDVAVCGNELLIDFEYPKLDKNQKEGKKLFRTLCASCHKLDKKLVGPALAQESMSFDYFLNYTINEERLLLNKNLNAITVNKEFSPMKYDHSFSQLKENQVKLIFNYINHN